MLSLKQNEKRGVPASMLGANKKRLFVLLMAAAGIFLIVLSSLSRQDGAESEISLGEYKLQLEEELAELCSSVEGAGKCRVCVTFEEGERAEYKGSSVISVTPPRVLGVTVICKGADSSEVRAAISGCMTAMFGIGANRVCVLKMK